LIDESLVLVAQKHKPETRVYGRLKPVPRPRFFGRVGFSSYCLTCVAWSRLIKS